MNIKREVPGKENESGDRGICDAVRVTATGAARKIEGGT
jgi:hypothetical protein